VRSNSDALGIDPPGASFFFLFFLQILNKGKTTRLRRGFAFGVSILGQFIRKIQEALALSLQTNSHGQPR
jgi:hypothetical protein